MHFQIAPHGGELVNRVVRGKEREFWNDKAHSLPAVTVDERTITDIEMIGTGAMSPLEGFMCRDDYNHVLEFMRLKSGLPWSLPVVLGVTADEADDFDTDSQIALKDARGTVIAVLYLHEKFTVDKEREAAKVFQTTDPAHPGVQLLMQRPNVLLGGDIDVVNLPIHDTYGEYRLTPLETRHAFEQRSWRRIVSFHTRNPIHRAHEYIQKCALEVCDGLLIHPLISECQSEDLPMDVLMRCYETLVDEYFPQERALLNIFPGARRYAGPREAVFHAITRKNYGCTHIIVGRNHADVGSYYGAYDAQDIFKEFGPRELDITPLFFEDAVYCRRCMGMMTNKTCPHSADHHVTMGGTRLREMLQGGEDVPPEFARPEIVKVIREALQRA